jgi:GPH family glycoside/pentoside/hexuronide:cation symporter
LIFFYSPPADSGLPQLLPLGLVGLLLGVLQIIGSLDDVLIGYWSDRTRSRLGRRLPFILVGSPLAALFAVLVVVPPTNSSMAAIAVHLFIMMELYNIFATVAGGPYEALLPELARTNRERLDLVSLRTLFGVAGAAIGFVVSGLLVDRIGVQAMMIGMVGLFFVCRLLGVLGVWPFVRRDQAPAELSPRVALGATLRDQQFVVFLPTFVLFQVGLAMILGVLPYYVSAVIGPTSVGTWSAVLTGVAIVAMLVAMPFVRRFALRRSKAAAYRLTMLAAGLAFPLLYFAGFVPALPLVPQVIVAMALCGAPLVGIYIFPAALVSDIVDHDAARMGMRREAIYFGVQSFVDKTATSLAPVFLTLLLSLGSTASNPLGIRLVGPVAGLFMLVSVWTFRRYSLPDHPPADPPAAIAPDRQRQRIEVAVGQLPDRGAPIAQA